MYHANVKENLMEQNVIQINGGKTINPDGECKMHHICQKDYVQNLATCNSDNGNYLANIMNKIICYETIDFKETNFNDKNIICKTQNLNILLIFLLFYYLPLHY